MTSDGYLPSYGTQIFFLDLKCFATLNSLNNRLISARATISRLFPEYFVEGTLRCSASSSSLVPDKLQIFPSNSRCLSSKSNVAMLYSTINNTSHTFCSILTILAIKFLSSNPYNCILVTAPNVPLCNAYFIYTNDDDQNNMRKAKLKCTAQPRGIDKKQPRMRHSCPLTGSKSTRKRTLGRRVGVDLSLGLI